MHCKYGFEVARCHSANKHLPILDQTPNACDSCNVEKTIPAVVTTWHESPTRRQKRTALAWMQEIGFSEDVVAQLGAQQQPTGIHFTCPETKHPIAIPCRMSECRFHVDFPYSLNCVLAYMDQNEVDRLSPEEIAFLYKIPEQEVTTLLKKGMQELRAGVLAHDDDALRRRFSFVRSDAVCCVCESRITNDEEAEDIAGLGLAYCSVDCRKEKPVWAIRLEDQYGVEIKDVMQWAVAQFDTLSLVASALGIRDSEARWACRAYLMVEPDEHFAALRAAHLGKALVRRTWTPSTIVTMLCRDLRKKVKAFERTFGPAGSDLSDLRTQLETVMEM